MGKDSLLESKAIFVHSLPINMEFLSQAAVSPLHTVCSDHHFVCCKRLAIGRPSRTCEWVAYHIYIETVTSSLWSSVYTKIKSKLPNKERYQLQIQIWITLTGILKLVRSSTSYSGSCTPGLVYSLHITHNLYTVHCTWTTYPLQMKWSYWWKKTSKNKCHMNDLLEILACFVSIFLWGKLSGGWECISLENQLFYFVILFCYFV